MNEVMSGIKYQRLASRTINPALTKKELEHHALFGMASELGEIQGIYQKTYQGHDFDPVHLKSELGDLLWFIAEYCTAMDWHLEDVMQNNILKLMERYPAGFDTEHSLHRKAGDI